MALWSPALLIPIAALLVPSYFYIKYKRSNSPILPVIWPVVGILPGILANVNNLHEFITVGLSASTCNYKVHGPVGTRVQYFLTSDPQNVRHIFTSNHANYPKGEEFAEVFDVMKGGLFTVDGESCRRHRAKMQSILSNPRMLASITNFCHDKVGKGLLPFLADMANAGTAFDMQQLNTRYAFDLAAKPVFGLDPGLLSPDMPPVDVTDAMDTVTEVPMFRHVMPALVWKVMRWLNIGPERRIAAAQAVLRGFVVKMMETRKTRRHSVGEEEDEAASLDIQSYYINDPNYGDDDQVLQATLIGYLVAGRDTVGAGLSWLFYNISRNPSVLSSIRKELAPIASCKAAAAAAAATYKETNATATVTFEPEEMKELVYLQAAVFETLRLYPPAPFERKTVLRDDTLPSGDEVGAGDTILISLYAMARMEPVWGNDCQEYRPERWFSDDGSKLQYVPSHKFLTFSSGPRMCLGKDIGIMQVKTAAANVLWNFDMEVLEVHAVEPKLSTILQMKNGLMVKVKKRFQE
ncbi:alkane hydroxylase MAH1-like [Miscanthus floridulus]|uniref:alkane hydroxylase MAH1-like n=1 Tax=Miscanthus floridulus TaxID=154761 RepID=UPI00345A0E9C